VRTAASTFSATFAPFRRLFVMAGLVPAIHVLVLLAKIVSRGCPAQGRA
jgi:hypothetical protein